MYISGFGVQKSFQNLHSKQKRRFLSYFRLQKQANFINQFGEGLIWNNVVIVAKQPGSFNLEQAVQGKILTRSI